MGCLWRVCPFEAWTHSEPPLKSLQKNGHQGQPTRCPLIDRQKDPAELDNGAAEHPEIVERLKALLLEQWAKGGAQPLPS